MFRITASQQDIIKRIRSNGYVRILSYYSEGAYYFIELNILTQLGSTYFKLFSDSFTNQSDGLRT